MTYIVTDQAIDTLARTVWGEARGEGRLGMEAVAAIIMNRVTHPRWWGHDIIGVCQAPWQFSCWNTNDPNRAKLLAVHASTDPVFMTALAVAEAAANGTRADPTHGADSYYAAGSPVPAWAATARFCASIGRHLFYACEIAEPAGAAPDVRNVSADSLNADELKDVT